MTRWQDPNSAPLGTVEVWLAAIALWLVIIGVGFYLAGVIL